MQQRVYTSTVINGKWNDHVSLCDFRSGLTTFALNEYCIVLCR